MSKRNVYEGPHSCYAVHEGFYVEDGGVNLKTAPKILMLMLRDLKRGWTYDRSTCERIPFTEEHFRRRARYLIALFKKHAGRDSKALRALVDYVVEHKEPPSWAVEAMKAGEDLEEAYKRWLAKAEKKRKRELVAVTTR